MNGPKIGAEWTNIVGYERAQIRLGLDVPYGMWLCSVHQMTNCGTVTNMAPASSLTPDCVYREIKGFAVGDCASSEKRSTFLCSLARHFRMGYKSRLPATGPPKSRPNSGPTHSDWRGRSWLVHEREFVGFGAERPNPQPGPTDSTADVDAQHTHAGSHVLKFGAAPPRDSLRKLHAHTTFAPRLTPAFTAPELPQAQPVQVATKQGPTDPLMLPTVPHVFETPQELREFREQCATGVRQSVAMITAMEHQLFWERSRRQQAEDDCKVHLGAINVEREAAGEQVASLEQAIMHAKNRLAEDKLKFSADQLPEANKAATAIQKHVRGNRARREYEEELRNILRGVDPSLDPSALPPSAKQLLNNANQSLGGGRPTLSGSGGAFHKHPSPELLQYQKEVKMIEKRLLTVEGSGDSANVNELDAILKGSYAGGSAQVIAALVRRCKELQRALIQASEQLDNERLSNEGLRRNNMGVLELSNIHLELQQERAAKINLQQQVAKLRHLALQQGEAGGHGGAAANFNPYVASFYRKAFAPHEFDGYPPQGLGPNGVRRGPTYVFDGPHAETETWDDLRMSTPDPVLIPAETAKLQRDMAASAQKDFVDPLYAASAPDTTFFEYNRDTPLPLPNNSPSFQPPPFPQAMMGPVTMLPDYPPGELYGQYHEEHEVLAPATPQYVHPPPVLLPSVLQPAYTPADLAPMPPTTYTPVPDLEKALGLGFSLAPTPNPFDYNTDTPKMKIFSPSPLTGPISAFQHQQGSYNMMVAGVDGGHPTQGIVRPVGPDDFTFRIAQPD
eukprot:gene17658-24005_t